MLRTPATFAFVLAELLSSAPAGVPSMPSGVNSSPEELAGRAIPQVGPGTVDVENVFLPAVYVVSSLDYFGQIVPMHCSGILVDPLLVITAAHCVCPPRAPTPQDMLLLGTLRDPLSDAGTMGPRALDGMTIKGIFDGSSSCATDSMVKTVVYGKPGDNQSFKVAEYKGKVLIHSEFALVFVTKNGELWTLRNHADLAAIYLDRPAPFPPIGLPDSEVKVGDALVMAGYGPTEVGTRVGSGPRRFGPNTVTAFVNIGKGNVLIVAADQPSPDGGVPSNLRRGDSGGPAVRKSAPNVLVGIATTGGPSRDGGEISCFTSAFENKGWISERIRQAHHAADAGVDASGSDAGQAR